MRFSNKPSFCFTLYFIKIKNIFFSIIPIKPNLYTKTKKLKLYNYFSIKKKIYAQFF